MATHIYSGKEVTVTRFFFNDTAQLESGEVVSVGMLIPVKNPVGMPPAPKTPDNQDPSIPPIPYSPPTPDALQPKGKPK